MIIEWGLLANIIGVFTPLILVLVTYTKTWSKFDLLIDNLTTDVKLLQDTARKNNMTVLIITHNQAIAPMADRVIKMKSGKIEENNLSHNSSFEDITYKEIDGKIGPKEPIYCFCNYVSYGNMIKCDNPKCEKEWFHFHCVGLRNLPKGKWFCSEKCASEYKNSLKN